MTLFAPPPVPVFAAGYSYLNTDFNTLIQDSLGFCTTGIVFRADQESGNQSLSSSGSGNNVITYDTVLEDPYGGWSATATGSQLAHSWLAPYTGWYEVTTTYSIATANVITEAIVLVTNATEYDLCEITNVSQTEGGGGGSVIVPLIGGVDYLQGLVQVSANVTTDTSAPGRYPQMQVSFYSQ